MDRKQIENEHNRLIEILQKAEVSEHKIKALEVVINHCAFMRVKLDEAMENLMDQGMSIPYNHGGGQSGTRENPEFKGYENLLKIYKAYLDRILMELPEEIRSEIPTAASTDNVLQMVKAMKKEKKAQ